MVKTQKTYFFTDSGRESDTYYVTPYTSQQHTIVLKIIEFSINISVMAEGTRIFRTPIKMNYSKHLKKFRILDGRTSSTPRIYRYVIHLEYASPLRMNYIAYKIPGEFPLSTKYMLKVLSPISSKQVAAEQSRQDETESLEVSVVWSYRP